MSETKPHFRLKADGSVMALGDQNRKYFYAHNDPTEHSMLAGFMPSVVEPSDMLERSHRKQVARTLLSMERSGFIKNVIEASITMVVGTGLKISSRPNAKALGWSQEQASNFASDFEALVNAWAAKPYSCDASGFFTFGGLQQAYYLSELTYGEGLSLLPNITRPGNRYSTKVKVLPPSRIVDKTDGRKIIQGVETDGWGLPIAYYIWSYDRHGNEVEKRILARDRDGRANVIHRFMPTIATTRNSPSLRAGMKAFRQFDQYGDANVVQKMVRSIFGAVIKNSIPGMAAFEGLMTSGEMVGAARAPSFDFGKFAAAKSQYYKGHELDLSNHGRIASLFPGDELDFVESKAANDEFDPIARWLMLEVAGAAGISYESATGDYRSATYSSVRMAGAKEWGTVLRKRNEILAPFCQEVAEALLEEAIYKGTIDVPGGFDFFLEHRDEIARCSWSGPAQPQADEFKAARAAEVQLDAGFAAMQDICDDYGRDYEDMLERQARENQMAADKGLPLPHRDRNAVSGDQSEDAELGDSKDANQGERKKPKKLRRKRRGGVEDTPEDEPADALIREGTSGDE
jgi:lambda family phage portal protein